MDNKEYRFSPEAERKFQELEKKFPQRSSLVLPALHLVQEEVGYIPPSAIAYVAKKVGVEPAWVAGVVSFYEKYKEYPPGKYHIEICRGISCYLKGCDTLVEKLREKLRVEEEIPTKDGLFSYQQIECIAYCDKAPAILMNGKYWGEVSWEELEGWIDKKKEEESA